MTADFGHPIFRREALDHYVKTRALRRAAAARFRHTWLWLVLLGLIGGATAALAWRVPRRQTAQVWSVADPSARLFVARTAGSGALPSPATATVACAGQPPQTATILGIADPATLDPDLIMRLTAGDTRPLGRDAFVYLRTDAAIPGLVNCRAHVDVGAQRALDLIIIPEIAVTGR